MKQTPNEFYQSEIKKHQLGLQKLKKQLFVSSSIRLMVFLLLCVIWYFFFGNAQWMIASIVVGIFAFILLVSRHSELKKQKRVYEQLISQCTTELTVAEGVFDTLPTGESYKNAGHAFSHDIDIFGPRSFYQYLNRTALDSGAQYLASLLTENTIVNIPNKQEAIKELGQKAEWRQHFTAVASLLKVEVPAQTIVTWLNEYKAFVPTWANWASRLFSIVSVLLGVAYYFDLFSGYLLGGWFFLGLLISGVYLKKVNQLSAHTSQVQQTFEQFYSLIAEIETEIFTSQILSEKKIRITSEKDKASKILKQFAKHLGALDQRNNMLIGVLANGFFLRDMSIARDIEKWIATHASKVNDWFEVLTFMDAYNSLGNYAFNHPTLPFPTIVEGEMVLQSEGAVHPLLRSDRIVRNDIKIEAEAFFIITGANMAGKSTFLRTVGLQIVMANVGLPVHSNKTTYSPIKLITSMRTEDSLTDNESYFFSELKRLKYVVDEIATDRYFIILDEILKGTNSTDKANGSRKFIEKLVRSNATGIIATHDLSLCEAANDFDEVYNYYFDATIENDELYFDYRFKEGICQNMNASFLLKKMEIVD